MCPADIPCSQHSSLAHCRRFPLEKRRSQMWLECQVARKLKVPSEEAGRSLTPG
jgi:hypothetical protein